MMKKLLPITLILLCNSATADISNTYDELYELNKELTNKPLVLNQGEAYSVESYGRLLKDVFQLSSELMRFNPEYNESFLDSFVKTTHSSKVYFSKERIADWVASQKGELIKNISDKKVQERFSARLSRINTTKETFKNLGDAKEFSQAIRLNTLINNLQEDLTKIRNNSKDKRDTENLPYKYILLAGLIGLWLGMRFHSKPVIKRVVKVMDPSSDDIFDSEEEASELNQNDWQELSGAIIRLINEDNVTEYSFNDENWDDIAADNKNWLISESFASERLVESLTGIAGEKGWRIQRAVRYDSVVENIDSFSKLSFNIDEVIDENIEELGYLFQSANIKINYFATSDKEVIGNKSSINKSIKSFLKGLYSIGSQHIEANQLELTSYYDESFDRIIIDAIIKGVRVNLSVLKENNLINREESSISHFNQAERELQKLGASIAIEASQTKSVKETHFSLSFSPMTLSTSLSSHQREASI